MRIATWNVNSIRQRLEHLLHFLKDHKPDIVCLQELKCQIDDFPFLDIQMAGYHAQVSGQKAYNGVALLSREPLQDVIVGLPGNQEDEQARFIEATFKGKNRPFRVASLYLPNGNPVSSEKYAYKLEWMKRLIDYTKLLLKSEMPFFLAGDFNVIPTVDDAAEPEAWKNDALFVLRTRQKYRELINLGLVDAIGQIRGIEPIYTFWDYQANSWTRNNGIRIDHVLLSPQAADCMKSAEVFKETRSWEKPSDHVPVLVTADL